MQKQDLMDKITARILADMEKGILPWEKPWVKNSNFPMNATSKKAYRGANVFWLACVAEDKGYSSNLWLTYHQAQQAGGHVKAGEKAAEVVFFKPLTVKEESEDGEESTKKIKLLKSFMVFNLDQTEGLNHLRPKTQAKEFNKNEEAERILKDSGAVILEKVLDEAFYNRTEDTINLPPRKFFKNEEAYYSTAFHELTHWTGSPARLNRKKGQMFGDADYAFEELVAEIGGAFLAGHVGYSYSTQHSAYVQNWAERLKADSRVIFRAASLAQSAADLLTGAKAPQEAALV